MTVLNFRQTLELHNKTSILLTNRLCHARFFSLLLLSMFQKQINPKTYTLWFYQIPTKILFPSTQVQVKEKDLLRNLFVTVGSFQYSGQMTLENSRQNTWDGKRACHELSFFEATDQQYVSTLVTTEFEYFQLDLEFFFLRLITPREL